MIIVSLYYNNNIKINKMKKVKLVFGYDLNNIEKVDLYVRKNVWSHNYEIIIERGEDVMNCLYINENELNDELKELINNCEGKGLGNWGE